MKLSLAVLTCAATIGFTGCKSMTSTALNRRSNDMLVQDTHSSNGVPIRVKVPSHLQVHITETYVLQQDKDTQKWEAVSMPQPLLDVHTGLRYTEKIFTVDFKRPAAGTSKYEAEFSDEQYFTKIKHELEDKTIKETSEAIGGLIGAIAKAGGRSSLATPSADIKNILTGERSVAWAEFDINEPCFEQNVQAFVHEHLNCCHNCSNPPWSYGVKYPEGFTPGKTCAETQAASYADGELIVQ